MFIKDYLLTGKCIFDDVWVNYHIVDENGKKMSKSAGNGIDPQDVLNKFGAESFRLWAALEGNLEKTDFRCSYERIEGCGKTVSKLWNVSKFIAMFKESKFKSMNEAESHLSELDKWVLNETLHMGNIRIALYRISKEQGIQSEQGIYNRAAACSDIHIESRHGCIIKNACANHADDNV